MLSVEQDEVAIIMREGSIHPNGVTWSVRWILPQIEHDIAITVMSRDEVMEHTRRIDISTGYVVCLKCNTTFDYSLAESIFWIPNARDC